jgi:Holliday junction resolvase-like predicted endonuclease
MTTSEQGRRGEAAVVSYFVNLGYEVFHPLFGNASCDLVVIRDNVLQRVECKSISVKALTGKGYVVGLRQVRHNRNSVTVNKFDASKSELLAVYVVPLQEVHVFDSEPLNGRSYLTVHGNKSESI